MRVVLADDRSHTVDLELNITDRHAPVSELLVALGRVAPGQSQAGGEGQPGLVVDGRFCGADMALDEIGLHEGSTLVPGGPPHDVDAPAPAALELRVVGGLDAGRWLPLRAGHRITIGREAGSELCLEDAGVSRQHLRVTAGQSGGASVEDLGSANGTWIEGRRVQEAANVEPGTLLEAGDVALAVARTPPPGTVDSVRDFGPAGRVRFNRRERQRYPSEHGQVHNGASPQGRRSRGGGFLGRGDRGVERRLEELRDTLLASQASELARRRHALPDPAELIRRASTGDTRLWERRIADADFLLLNAGFAPAPFEPALDRGDIPPEEFAAMLKSLGTLALAPVELDLGPGALVGIAGPRAASLALARSLICQAGTLHGPADLVLALFTDPGGVADWDLLKWFPHVRDLAAGGSRRLLASDAAGTERLGAQLSEREDVGRRPLLAVLDGVALIEGEDAVGARLLDLPTTSAVVLAEHADQLPAVCNTVIELAEGTAEARLSRTNGETVDPLLATGVSDATARSCGLSLARFDDPELGAAALPTLIGLPSVLDLQSQSPDAVRSRWQANTNESGLWATFALGPDGPVDIDLIADGPHTLVAGAEGAGRPELLCSMVASLGADYSPEAVNFLLVGDGFSGYEELPHTVDTVSAGADLPKRTLDLLEREVKERRGRNAKTTRLVVVVEDLTALGREASDFAGRLLEQAGRVSTVHLVLGTRRTWGSISEETRAAAKIRLCLRVDSPDDSEDVIGVARASEISADQVGRGLLRIGGAALVPIQVGFVGSGNLAAGTGVVEIRDFSFAAVSASADPEAKRITPVLGSDKVDQDSGAQVSDLDRLVAAARGASDRPEPAPAAQEPEPALEPAAPAAEELQDASELPTDVPLETLSGYGAPRAFAGARGVTVPFTLLADPASNAHYPAGWNLDAGNLLILGGERTGKTTALSSIAMTLAILAPPDGVHLHALDNGAGGLAELARLPHAGEVISVADRDRQARLLAALRALVDGRAVSSQSQDDPRVVVLLDGYEALDPTPGTQPWTDLLAVFRGGPRVGVHVALSAERPGSIPPDLAAGLDQRVILALDDRGDYRQAGLPRPLTTTPPPGRALLAGAAPKRLQIAALQAPLGEMVSTIAGAHTSTPARPPLRLD